MKATTSSPGGNRVWLWNWRLIVNDLLLIQGSLILSWISDKTKLLIDH